MTPLPDAFPGALARPVRVAPAAGGRQALRQLGAPRPHWTALPLTLVFLWSAAGNPVAQADPLDHWTPLNPLPTGNRLNAVTYGGGLYVAVGEFGTLVASADATNWTAHSSGTRVDLHSVAWGANRFVAVGDAGLVLTSDDGQSWTLGGIDPGVRLRGVTHGGGKFVAVGETTAGPDGGHIWTSLDGMDWVRIEIADLPPLLAVSSDPEGLVATGADSRIFGSTDGVDWQTVPLSAANRWFSTAGRAGVRVAVGPAGKVARATAQGDWTVIDTGAEEWLYGVASGQHPATGEPVFVVVGAGGKILVSEDGLLWQSQTSGWDETLRAAVHGANGFVVVGDHGMIRQWTAGRQGWAARSLGVREWMVGAAQGSGTIVVAATSLSRTRPWDWSEATAIFLTSGDGAAWSRQTIADFKLNRMAYGEGLFVSVGSRIATSVNGTQWLTRRSGGNWIDVAHGNGVFVVLSDNWLRFRSNSQILVSADGVNWHSHDSGTQRALAAITWGSDRFVAVGHRGVIVVSLDGETWLEHASNTEEYLHDVTWGDGVFVAVGLGGAVITSPDGLTWTRRESGTRGSLNGVGHGGGLFVACGGDGILLVSEDGAHWSRRNVPSKAGLNQVAWVDGVFLVAGEEGLLLRSDPLSEPSPAWPVGIHGTPEMADSTNEPPAAGPSLRGNLKPMSDDPGAEVNTNLHHFAAIRHTPHHGVELVLAGSLSGEFEYDLFPVEVSDNLDDWRPWRTLLRTNSLGPIFTHWDDSVLTTSYRFFRTPTNHFPVTTLQPTGPYAVGRTWRSLELDTHPMRRTLLTYVWYPAEGEAGRLPVRWFGSTKLASRESPFWGRTGAEFDAARSHALHEPPFASHLTQCPVVLVSHGNWEALADQTEYAEDLASHGFVVIGVSGADTFVSLNPDMAGHEGRRFPYSSRDHTIAGRLQDVIGVIEQLSSWDLNDPALAGRMATDNLGMFGYSLGGATAMDLARLHPNCRAAINIDGAVPPDFLRPGYSAALLFVGSEESPGEHPAVIRELVESMDANAAFFRIRNTNHFRINRWHWWLDRLPRLRELVRRSVTSFFLEHLRGVDDGFFEVIELEYPEVYDFVRR